MQHADRECIVKDSCEGQVINVCLNDMHVSQLTGCGKGGLHSSAKIDADYISGAPTCDQRSVSSFSASAFEHSLVLEKPWDHRRDPAKELIRVEFVMVGEVLPLPAKVLRRGGFVRLKILGRCETRDAADDRKSARATFATELALDNLSIFRNSHRRQKDSSGTRRTSQVVE